MDTERLKRIANMNEMVILSEASSIEVDNEWLIQLGEKLHNLIQQKSIDLNQIDAQ